MPDQITIEEGVPSISPSHSPASRQTQIITQELERDIIQFLSSKHTENATLSIAEIMRFYDCSQECAKRVARNLVSQAVLVVEGKEMYRVAV